MFKSYFGVLRGSIKLSLEEMAEELRRDPKHLDFINVIVGFGHTGTKLEPYTRKRLQKLYQQIYGTLAGLPRCQQKCSSSYNFKFKRWCNTCSKWRAELLKSGKLGKVEWEKTESWNWPESYENMVEVFLPCKWKGKMKIQLSDISTQCHIWNTCNEFKLNETFLKNAQTARNSIFHNGELKVSKLEKSKAFDALKDLIKDPDTHGDIDVNTCLNELNIIEKGDCLSEHINAFHREWTKCQVSAENRQRNIEEKLCKISDQLTNSYNLNQVLLMIFDRVIDVFGRINVKVCSVLTAKAIFIFIAAILALASYYYIFNESANRGYVTVSDQGDCMSEDYAYPFPQDLPLMDYLRDHKNLVGRRWLFEKFDKLLFDSESPFRGIVSAADFGYGKSAIVSHLLCKGYAEERTKRLRKHIVAFHVCKFDVASTQSPERFIRRLVGFFATKSPEYGSIITMLSNESVLYDLGKCSNEIEACFDQAFRFPLQKLKNELMPWIIAIDALDECFHSSRRQNFILDLLKTRVHYLPKWIKFLITSRDIKELKTLRKLEIYHFLANDSHNLNDINIYIEEVYKERNKTVDQKSLKMIQEKSDGNFLYIIHALQYVLSPEFTGEIPEITPSLEDIYELNFDRQFQKGNSFDTAKLILEVICTTFNPLQKADIYKILANSMSFNKSYSDFNDEFQKLAFFVKVDSGVTLRHKAIHSWLLSSNNDIYHISQSDGHAMISKYLLQTVEQNGTGDVIDLVIHISESKDKSLQNFFLFFDLKNAIPFDEDTILHNLIEKTKLDKPLELLLSHHSNINILDKNGISPAFFAAAKGHLSQLKLLIRRGADVRFVVNPCRRCETHLSDSANAIEEIKTSVYSGYSLLHIAVQHNFVDMVNYLVRHPKVLLYLEDTVGQRPSDIACEKGYTDALRSFEYKNSKSYGIDEKCLYFATRGNHLDTVKYIIGIGVKPRCITNKTSISEFNRIKKPCKCKQTQKATDKIQPLDTWWTVFRETALHYAIRARYIDIAKYLLQETFLSNCTDAYGYMPLLLAIKYSTSPLVNMMSERASSDVCSPPSSILNDENQYQSIVHHLKEETVCPEGASFAHLLAIYDRKNFVNVFKNNQFLKWNMTDKLGNRPIHFAASRGSIRFINFMKSKFGESTLLENARNGSTSYHIAASSCSETSLKALTNNFQKSIPDTKDYNDRSILHYSLMCENLRPENVFYRYAFTSRTKEHLLKLLRITEVDTSGHNWLHYVLRFGHTDMLKYLISNFPEDLKDMLYSENCMKLNPVQFTLSYAPDIDILVSSDIKTIFNDGLSNLETAHNMYSWEICLVHILRFLSIEEVNGIFLKHFNIIMLKSPYITKAVLMKLKLATISVCDKIPEIGELIVRSIKASKDYRRKFLLTESLHSISYVMPKIFQVCGKALSKSPLNFLVWSSLDSSVENWIDLVSVVFKSLSYEERACSSTYGLNILHYSLKGGNVPLANYLMSHNLSLVTENVSAIDILYMAVFARPNDLKCNWMDQFSCIDVFLSKFIKRKRYDFIASDFCTNSSNNLSLVHIFAVNGMNRTLNAVSRLYGNEVLFCSNTHSFTPLYFAEVFGRQSVISFLDKHTQFLVPNASAEESLFLNILNNFPQFRREHPFQCLTFRKMGVNGFHGRKLFQDYKCLHNFYKGPFMSQDNFFISNLLYFREGLYLSRKLMLKYLDAKRNLMHVSVFHNITKCSLFVEQLLSCMHMMKNIMFWSEIKNQYFSWTEKYPFLERIVELLNISLNSESLHFTGYNIQTKCIVMEIRNIWNKLKHIEKIIKRLFQNLQEITVLVSLVDQKSFMKSHGVSIISKFAKDQLYNTFGFSACFNCPFFFVKDTVYNVNEFRYLNILKSTVTYKRIDNDRSRYTFIAMSQRHFDQINEKMKFMHKMVYKTKERQKWIAKNIKNEPIAKNLFSKCCNKSIFVKDVGYDEDINVYKITIPFI